MESNPRATNVCNTFNDDQQITKVLKQLHGLQNVSVFFILSKFLDCHQIKNQPQFCQILFNDHLQVILQLIQWMLLPKDIIKKKKININKVNIDSYPYQCRQFIKDNWCFYQQMYISTRNKKFHMSFWFNFLRKQYFDKDTIYTALGYFADVMIPFAKYEFSGSFNLTHSLQVYSLSSDIQTLSIMKILPETLIDELTQYCHYQPIYTFLKTAILVSIEDPRDYQVSKSALLKLIRGAQTKNIFTKFPISNQQDNEEVAKAMDYLENVANGVKELSQNIQLNSQAVFRSTAMISAVVQSNIIKYSINELIQSRLCRPPTIQKDKITISNPSNLTDSSQSSLSNSSNLSQMNASNNISINIYNNSPLPQLGALPLLVDGDEQQLAQTLLKILSTMVQVFVRLPRTLNFNHEQDQQINQQPPQVQIVITEAKDLTSSQSYQKIYKQKPKQFTYEQYENMIIQYRQQMQYLLDNMQLLNKFVFNEIQIGNKSSCAKIVPFASGQNVKAITFMKYEYFKLIYNVLIMIQCKGNNDNNHTAEQCNSPVSSKKNSKDKQSKSLKQIKEIQKQDSIKQQKDSIQQPATMDKIPSKQQKIFKLKSLPTQPFQFKIQKLQIIQIIKKYLNDNRWNNIAHHLLQKIIHSLIICQYDSIKKQLQKDKKKFSDSLLAFLIENFTKRDFVFLSTVRFSSQGNLHSLYNIAKDLAYTLNSTNKLVLFLNQFEPWKKFIMTDLKNYQEKIFPNATKPEIYDKSQDEQCSNLKVDEADSIKKLIQNISKIKKKWPIRNKNKNLSKSGVFEGRGSYESSTCDSFKNEPNESSLSVINLNKTWKDKFKQKQEEYDGQKGLQEILKKKIEYGGKNKQVIQFDIEEISVRDKLQKINKQWQNAQKLTKQSKNQNNQEKP